jgi:ribosomal protein S24E
MRCCASIWLCMEKMVRSPSGTLRGWVGCAAAHRTGCAWRRWCALRAAPYGDEKDALLRIDLAVHGEDGALSEQHPTGMGRMRCCASIWLCMEKMVRSLLEKHQDPGKARIMLRDERHSTGMSRMRCCASILLYMEKTVRSLLEKHQDPGKARIMLRDEQHPTGMSRMRCCASIFLCMEKTVRIERECASDAKLALAIFLFSLFSDDPEDTAASYHCLGFIGA